MAGMYLLWKLVKRSHWVKLEEMDLVTDRVAPGDEQADHQGSWAEKRKFFSDQGWIGKARAAGMWLFL